MLVLRLGANPADLQFELLFLEFFVAQVETIDIIVRLLLARINIRFSHVEQGFSASETLEISFI